MKHIVVSGCSFTRIISANTHFKHYDSNKSNLEQPPFQWSWPEFLKEKAGDNYQLWNEGSGTFDNSIIVNSLIRRISLLLKDGVKAEDIIVLTEFSTQNRYSFLIPQSQLKYDDLNPYKSGFGHIGGYLDTQDQIEKNGYFYLGASIINTSNPAQDWFNQYSETIWNEEFQHFSMLRNIFFLQTFLQAKHISNYLFFFMKNELVHNAEIFPQKERDAVFYTNLKFDNLLGGRKNTMDFLTLNNVVPYIKNHQLLKDYYNNEYINYYYDIIDWNNFWFYETDATKKSGMFEWVVGNSDKDKVLFTWHEEESYFIQKGIQNPTKEDTIKYLETQGFQGFHLSAEWNKIFVDEVILPNIIL